MSGELTAKGGQRIVKGRIRPALRTAIRLIVEEGLTQADAAKRVGYNAVSLSVALRKPHVRAVVVAVKRAWLENETGKAWRTMADLANGATSEDVRHKSAKVFLDAAGELDGSASGGAKGPPALVQIVINSDPKQGQPIVQRLPGVIESQPTQGKRGDPSNFEPVGWDAGDLIEAQALPREGS